MLKNCELLVYQLLTIFGAVFGHTVSGLPCERYGTTPKRDFGSLRVFPCPSLTLIGNYVDSWRFSNNVALQFFPYLTQKLRFYKSLRSVNLIHKHSSSCHAFIIVLCINKIDNLLLNNYEHIAIRSTDYFAFVKPSTILNCEIKQKLQFHTFLLTAFSDGINGRVRLNGLTVRSATVTVPPIVVQKNDFFGGTQVEMLKNAARNFNFTLILNFDTNKRGGQGRPLLNGTWTGIIGALKRDETDVSLIGHQVMRYPQVDHTSFLFVDPSSFLVKRPKIQVKWTALVGSLSATVWMSWLAALFSVIGMTWLKLKVRNSSYSTLFKSIIIPIAVTLDQSQKIPRHLRTVASLWIFASIILGTAYKDKLVSSLTFLEREQLPTSIEDFNLPAFKHYRLLQDGWLMSFRLNSSNNPVIKQMRGRFEYMPNGGECVVAASLQENTACIGYDQFLAVSISRNLTINSRFFAPVQKRKVIPGVSVSIGLHKNSPFTPDWNVIVGMFRDTGLYGRIHENVLSGLKRDGIQSLTAQMNKSQVYEDLKTMMEDDKLVVRQLAIKNLITLFFVHGLAGIVGLSVLLRDRTVAYSQKPTQKSHICTYTTSHVIVVPPHCQARRNSAPVES